MGSTPTLARIGDQTHDRNLDAIREAFRRMGIDLTNEVDRATEVDAFLVAARIQILESLGHEIGSAEHLVNKGQPSGYAPLDSDSMVPLANLLRDFDDYGPFAEEFLGVGVPTLGIYTQWPWLVGIPTSGGTCVVVADTTTYRSGVVGVTTTTSATAGYRIATDNLYNVQARRLVFETVVRIPVLSTSSERFKAAVGLNTPNIGTTSAHFCLYTSDNVNSGRWLLAYALGDGSAEVTVDSGVMAVQAGRWYRCKFWWDAAKAYCSIDATVMSGVALVPTDTTAFRYAAAYILKSVGTTLRQVDIDKCRLYQDASVARAIS